VAILAENSLWALALAAMAVVSWSITITIMVGITYRQLAAPDELRSSVNVIGRMTAWGGQPFGAATGALIAASADVPAAYAVAAVVMVISALGAAVSLKTPRGESDLAL
jgi:acyl-coenzyme A thioesterase PaaI-like protein